MSTNNLNANEEAEPSLDPELVKRIVWRDFSFLLLALAASFCISFIEVNAGKSADNDGSFAAVFLLAY